MNELVTWNENYITKNGLNLPEGLPFETWEDYVFKMRQITKFSLWVWGDLIIYGERNYGEKYSQALDESDYSYGVIANAVWLCKKFETSRRRENLPMSFHQEVASLPEEDQDSLLDLCENENLTQKELRQEVRKVKQSTKEAPPLPGGKYNLIYADPPWKYDFSETMTREIENNYPTMELEDICDLEVPADNDCVLYLWATAPKLL